MTENNQTMKNTSKVKVDGFGEKETGNLAAVTKDLATSYFSKPADQGLLDWLGNELKKYLPHNIVMDTARDILNSVDEFNQNLEELNAHCTAGKYKETWLRDKLREPMDGMDAKAQGEYLIDVQEALSAGNQTLAAAIGAEGNVVINPEKILEKNSAVADKTNIQWDRQMLGMTGMDIANQVNLTAAAIASASDGIDTTTYFGECDFAELDIADVDIDPTLDKGLKIIASASLSICAITGKIPILKRVATPILVNMACVGVEGIKAIALFGQGKISASKTLERIERAVTTGAVGVIRHGTEMGTQLLAQLPVVGAMVSTAIASNIGGLTEKKVEQFIHEGIEKIRPYAMTALETAKSVALKAADTVKRFATNLLTSV